MTLDPLTVLEAMEWSATLTRILLKSCGVEDIEVRAHLGGFDLLPVYPGSKATMQRDIDAAMKCWASEAPERMQAHIGIRFPDGYEAPQREEGGVWVYASDR